MLQAPAALTVAGYTPYKLVEHVRSGGCIPSAKICGLCIELVSKFFFNLVDEDDGWGCANLSNT